MFLDVPAAPKTLLCFAEFLLRSFNAAKSVLNALASVRTLHTQLGASTEAFDGQALRYWKRALPFTIRSVVSQAPPLPISVLVKLCTLAHSLGDRGRVFAALLSTTFFSMARISSLLPTSMTAFDPTRSPCLADVTFTGNSCTLLIRWGKNLQDTAQAYRVPLLPFEPAAACPVANLKVLVRLLGQPTVLIPSWNDLQLSQSS